MPTVKGQIAGDRETCEHGEALKRLRIKTSKLSEVFLHIR